MKKTALLLIFALVLVSGVSAINNASDAQIVFVFNTTDGNGDIPNLGSATAVLKDVSGASVGASECYNGFNGCSLTDGTNDAWHLNISATGAEYPLFVDGKNITCFILFNATGTESSGDFYAFDNDAAFLQAKTNGQINFTYSETASYPNVYTGINTDNWVFAWIGLKQNSSAWTAWTRQNWNGTENRIASSNGNFQVEGETTFGDRHTGTKAVKAYYQVVACWQNRILNDSTMEVVENAIRAGNANPASFTDYVPSGGDTTPPDRPHFTNVMYKNNESLYYTWQNPTDADFNHTQIHIGSDDIGHFQINYWNITGLSANTCYNVIFIAVDNSSNAAANWTDYQCTDENGYVPMNSTNTNADPYLFRSKYQTEQGIAGGEASQRIFALDCNNNPAYDNICYAGTDTTTAWQWNGTQWYKIARNVTGVEGVSSIIGDYNNPFYVCAWFGRMSGSPDGTESGLYCSKDGGITWTQKLTSLAPKRQNNGQQVFYDTDTFNGTCTRNIYAGSLRGLYYSTNCGDSWSAVNTIEDYINDIAGNSSGAYVATNTSLYYLRFSDNNMTKLAASGMTTTGNALRDCAVNATNNKMLICGSTDVYKSTDSGASFSLLYNPSGSVHRVYWGINTMIISPDSVGGEKPYYSTDGGTSWTNSDLNVTQGFHVDDTWYYASPVSCYSDDSKCFVPFSSGGWIGVSEDYGATFNDLGSSGMTGARVVDMQFVRKDLAYVPLWDMGLRLTNLTSGYTIDLNISESAGSSISAGFVIVANWTSPTSCVIVTTDGTWSTPDMDIIRSTDCGATWSTVQADTGHEYDYGEVCKDNNNLMVTGFHYATGGGYYSTDNGATWSAFPAGYYVSDMDSLCNIYAIKDNGATLGIYNASPSDYSSFSLIVSATTSESLSMGGVKVDPFDTGHFLFGALDSGIFECDTSSCTIRAAAAGLPTTPNYKWVAFNPNMKDMVVSGKIPYTTSGFPAYPYCSFNGGTNWQQCLFNLGDMPSYGAFFNPYGTKNDLYFSGAGLWKATTGETVVGDFDYPPIAATGLVNVSTTNDTIYINWTVPYFYGDENDTQIWVNGINIANQSYDEFGWINYSLTNNTAYRFDIITTDNAGQHGANGTITLITYQNNVTPSLVGDFPMILNNLKYTANFTFLQKPYFLYLNITGNNTGNVPMEWQWTASSSVSDLTCSGTENDNNYATYCRPASGNTDEHHINKTFYNHANYTDRELHGTIYFQARYNSYVTAYCYGSSGYQSIGTYYGGSADIYETVYQNFTIPEACRDDSTIKIKYIFKSLYGSGYSFYFNDAEIYTVAPYYVQFMDTTIFNSTNATNTSFKMNLTGHGNNITGNKFNITYGTAGLSTFDYNVSYGFLYNKSINISILDSATNASLNPLCSFNGAVVYPSSAFVYYNSSLANWLNCTLSGYGGVSSYIYPTYDNLTLYMGAFDLNISIYDEQTDQLIMNKSIYVYIVQGSYAANYSTYNGTLFLSALTMPTGSFEIRYGGLNDDYATRSYFVTLQNASSIELYTVLLNQSSLITFNVVDERGYPVTDAYLKVQRYFIADGAYKLVGMETIDDTGTAGMYLVPNTVPYIVYVEKDSEVVFLSTANKIFMDTIQIYASLLDNPLESFYKINQQLTSYLTYSNATKLLTYFWNDASGIVTTACIEVTYRGSTGIGTLTSSCTSAASGTIVLNMTGLMLNNTEYEAHGKVYTNTAYSEYITDFLVLYHAAGIYEALGKTGLFFSWFLIITMFFVGITIAFDVAVVYTALAMIVVTVIGSAWFSVGLIAAICLLGVLMAIASKRT